MTTTAMAETSGLDMAAPPHPRRILVVDDNEPSALTLTWAMEMHGYEVRTCFDGRAAIVEAGQFDPDIVLLDLGMPVVDGFEVCRCLRKNPALKHTTVIAQTGWGSAEMRQRTQDAGFNHHLTKPVNIDELLGLIAKTEH